MLLEFLQSTEALTVISDHLQGICAARMLMAKLRYVLSCYDGHPADLLNGSFNPWTLTKSRLHKLSPKRAAVELRKIASNSRTFLDAVNSVGKKNQGLVKTLMTADAADGCMASSCFRASTNGKQMNIAPSSHQSKTFGVHKPQHSANVNFKNKSRH